jgi:hypothetical protein
MSQCLGVGNSWGRGWTRAKARASSTCRSDPLPAAPPHRRTAAVCEADTRSVRPLCAYGPNPTFLLVFPGSDLPPRAAAPSPAPSAPLQPPPHAQVRPCATARCGNEAESCHLWRPEFSCKWIFFWLFRCPPSLLPLLVACCLRLPLLLAVFACCLLP